MSKKPPKPGVVPPPTKSEREIDRFLRASFGAISPRKPATLARDAKATAREFLDSTTKGRKPSPKAREQIRDATKPTEAAWPVSPDDGPLVVLVDSPRGTVARSLRQQSSRVFAFTSRPDGAVTRSLEEPGMSSSSLWPVAEAIGSQGGAGAAIGAIAGGVLGALLAGRTTPRRPNPVAPLGAPRFMSTSALRTATAYLAAFALSEDTIAQTGVAAGDAPPWALCLATLTDAWCDPYVIMEAMVRDQALLALLERTGEGMREASTKGGTFDLQRVATDVRAMLAPGR